MLYIFIEINGFKFYFIDVGQGDCSLIKLNSNKTILIDGGEGGSSKTDKGRSVVFPYLMDRKINKIDYMIFSHFDSDHAGGLLYILEKMKVSNVIIGIQNEDSLIYRKLLDIVNKKDINLIIIDNKKVLKIDDIFIEFLWPIKEALITENKLNNNSLVFRVIYRNIKILFTGDIEAISENKMLEIYKNDIKRLEANILKVAHHGSKTSSLEEFIKVVNPDIALIGVGKNNKFEHPSEIVLDRLKNLNVKIYRTDLYGEIIVYIDNENVKIKKKMNNFSKIINTTNR